MTLPSTAGTAGWRADGTAGPAPKSRRIGCGHSASGTTTYTALAMPKVIASSGSKMLRPRRMKMITLFERLNF